MKPNNRDHSVKVFIVAFAVFLSLGIRVLGQGCTSNPIVCENALTGNVGTEWDVGVGDASIQGFATDISVNRGQTVTFKINTIAAAYRIDIYRLGDHAGRGARKVATINPSVSLPQIQPTCLRDPATGLVDCGNWAASASWVITFECHLGSLRRQTGPNGHKRGQSHHIHCARRHRAIRYPFSDVRHDMACL